MNREFLTELYQIAGREKVLATELKDWVQRLDGLGSEVHQLAKRIRGVSELSETQVIPTFFTPAAVTILMRMPNKYWFWRIVRLAVLKRHNDIELIPADAVDRAIMDERVHVGLHLNLKRDIDELTLDEAAFWQCMGVTMVDGRVRRRNPIFAVNAEEVL